MLRFLIKRSLVAVVTLIGISAVTFLIFFAVPSSPALVMCSKNCTPTNMAAVERSLGLDKPLLTQYVDFHKGIFVGRTMPNYGECPAPCLGYSFRTREPVLNIISRALPVTVSIVLGAAVIWLTIGISLGMFSALRQGTTFDKVSIGVSLVGASMPVYFFAMILLLIFVFGGYDVVPVPAGEAIDPRRHVPFALIATILTVTAVMTLGQMVAQGVLPDLPAHDRPIADAAAVMLGVGGALLVSVGSVVSMTGNNAGALLTGSRMLFALAEHGELPRFFGRIHPRFRTPANAILFTAAVALALALTGSFAKLAIVSALARLVTYTGTCAATLRLRAPAFAGRVKPAAFVAPLGPLVPIVAIGVSVAVVAGASQQQLLGGLAALAAGAGLFAANAWSTRHPH